MDDKKKKPEKVSPPNNLLKGLIFWAIIGIVLVSLARFSSMEGKREKMIYSQFLQEIEKNNIAEPILLKEGDIYGTLKNGTKFSTYSKDPDIYKTLKEHNISFNAERASNFWANLFVSTIPVILIFLLLWFMLYRQVSGEGNKIMSFSKSRPAVLGTKKKITFDDVAGSKEAKSELEEIIEYLKNPAKFQKLGGKIPKGVLLIGPPGTGKTLLAKAVSGEAKVPFFGMSGSDFVEMFVGVGASRVRDLFKQAKKVNPSIVFIDEIDAVGRQRFAGVGGGHDEREQTLNQLLVEMDGFQTDEGIIVMAATNRPDVLDPALTRPGRFDRTVVVSLPDIREREKILEVHMKGKPIDKSVDLKVLARATPGLSGADLANVVNESALTAAKKNKSVIDMEDFEDSKDKVFMGVERRSLVISDEEKEIIAYHEAGHTLVQKSLPEVYPVHKVTIIPRGHALGTTHTIPEKDKFIESNSYYKHTITSLLAGRASEKLVFGKMFTGSEHDLRIATEIARKMICAWGMSERLGPVSFRDNDAVFLGRDLVQSREHSEVTSREIDEEVRAILQEGERRAIKILTANRDKLDALEKALLEKETLESDEIDKILGIAVKPADDKGSLFEVRENSKQKV